MAVFNLAVSYSGVQLCTYVYGTVGINNISSIQTVLMFGDSALILEGGTFSLTVPFYRNPRRL